MGRFAKDTGNHMTCHFDSTVEEAWQLLRLSAKIGLTNSHNDRVYNIQLNSRCTYGHLPSLEQFCRTICAHNLSGSINLMNKVS